MRDEELHDALADILATAPTEPPLDRIAALRAEAESARGDRHPLPSGVDAVPSAMRGPRRGRWPVLAAAAALIVVVVVGGTIVATDHDPPGTLEYAGPISGDDVNGSLTVRKTGIGRVIELDTDDLEILPTGEFYEIWFVGPGDTPESPNRISGGTFHPDPDGRSDVTFAAAVDPALYPTVEVTAEPGDGDPGPTLPALAAVDVTP